MDIRKELSDSHQKLALVLAVLLAQETPSGKSVVGCIQQLRATRNFWQGSNATNLGPNKHTLSQDKATALPLVQEDQQQDSNEMTASPRLTLAHGKEIQDGSREQGWEVQAKTMEQENKDLRAWKTEHLQELDRLRLLVEYLESENQNFGQQKQQSGKRKKRTGGTEPCPDPASMVSETTFGDLELNPLASLKASLLKHADALRRNRYFIEAMKRDSPQGHLNKSPSIYLWNTCVESSLKQIIGELSRWQLALPKDAYGEQFFLYKRYLDLVRDNLVASTLTVSQLTTVLEDIGSWFTRQLESEDSLSAVANYGGNMSILIVECLCTQSVHGSDDFRSCQLSFCISCTLLRVLLAVIVEKTEKGPLPRFKDSEAHVQGRQRVATTRTLAKTKALARMSKARESLLQQHDQLVQDRKCARYISLAVRISTLKASSTHNSFNSTLLERSSLDDLVRTLEGKRRLLMNHDRWF